MFSSNHHVVINLRMIPKLSTFPEKQINKPKNQQETPLTLNAPFYSLSPFPPLFSTVSINLLSFLVVSKLQPAFPSPWNSSLLMLLFQYACFSITFFLSVFCISFSLSSSLYTSLVQKEQYFSLRHSSVHYSLCVNPSFCFGYKLPRRRK